MRAVSGPDPDPNELAAQHTGYIEALKQAGVAVTILPALVEFPDSVFVEDAALCIANAAIILRPGAPSRRGEAAAIAPALRQTFAEVIELPGPGHVDGGDILAFDDEVLIGLSERTDKTAVAALASILADLGLPTRTVMTPPQILHFKSDCGLLDNRTVLTTPRLAASGCFADYRIIETAPGEEAAANCIRVNDTVFLRADMPKTAARLHQQGYRLTLLQISEAAKIDGGLSCMSLRF